MERFHQRLDASECSFRERKTFFSNETPGTILVSFESKKGCGTLDVMSRRVLQQTEMSMDWKKFKEFLRNLGVEWGSEAPLSQTVPAEEESEVHVLHIVNREPLITVLQRSHDHEALYRVDWLETGPELLVLLPTQQAPLKFHFYLVTLSTTYPLHDALTRLMQHQGSDGFEQRREVAEWHLLHATVETMKALFWTGQEKAQFPHEIVVQKIG